MKDSDIGDVPVHSITNIPRQTSEVLKVLEEKCMMTAPAPFPQSAQYKKADEADVDNQDEPGTEKPRQKRKKKSKNKRRAPAQVAKAFKGDPKAEPAVVVPDEFKPATPDETYTPARYSELRKHFVSEKMAAGMSWKDAQAEWNRGNLKRQLLSSLDLPELKKRRFVSKDCTTNPWAS